MLRSCRIAAAAAALAVAAPPAAIGGDEPAESEIPQLWSLGTRYPLDTTRVAVFYAGSTPEATLAALASTGLTSARAGLEPGPADLCSFMPIEGTEAGVVAALEAARAARENAGASRDAGGEADPVPYVAPVFVGHDGGPVVPTPSLLVGFEDEHAGAGRAALDAFVESELAAVGLSGSIDRPFDGVEHLVVTTDAVDGRDVLAAAELLAAAPGVAYAEPDMLFTGRAALVPNDPRYPSSWAFNNSNGYDMDAQQAWDITVGSPEIITVVIDSGSDAAHPDLNQVPGFTYTGEGGNGVPITSCDNHGTAVAGCISAKIDNGLNVVGIAPGTVTMPVKAMYTEDPEPGETCDGTWIGVSSWTVNAIRWAETIGARVTNNSNSYGFSSSAIGRWYANTKAAGVVHFAAAGNAESEGVSYPGLLPEVNAVGAVDSSGSLASFSNFGSGLFCVAPGDQIWTTDRTGADGYGPGDDAQISGTSFASPYAAGVAALLFSVKPELTPEEVEQTLADTARDLGDPGFDSIFGWGMVNALNALRAVTPCPGDLNGDGTLGFFDLVEFLTAFAAMDPSADLDGNGSFGFFDLVEYLNFFVVGCP